MRIPGPYSDDTWLLLSRPQRAEPRKTPAKNDFPHVAWELGLVLCVPLAGASIIGMLLKAFSIS